MLSSRLSSLNSPASPSGNRDTETTSQTEVNSTHEGMRVLGVPVGTPSYQRALPQDLVKGEPAELLRSLMQVEGTQASFKIIGVSTPTKLHLLLRKSPPPPDDQVCTRGVRRPPHRVDPGVNSIGNRCALETPKVLAEILCTYGADRKQRALSPDAIHRARLPVKEGSYGLARAANIVGQDFLEYQTLVLAKAIATPEPRNFVRRFDAIAKATSLQAHC